MARCLDVIKSIHLIFTFASLPISKNYFPSPMSCRGLVATYCNSSFCVADPFLKWSNFWRQKMARVVWWMLLISFQRSIAQPPVTWWNRLVYQKRYHFLSLGCMENFHFEIGTGTFWCFFNDNWQSFSFQLRFLVVSAMAFINSMLMNMLEESWELDRIDDIGISCAWLFFEATLGSERGFMLTKLRGAHAGCCWKETFAACKDRAIY